MILRHRLPIVAAFCSHKKDGQMTRQEMDQRNYEEISCYFHIDVKVFYNDVVVIPFVRRYCHECRHLLLRYCQSLLVVVIDVLLFVLLTSVPRMQYELW